MYYSLNSLARFKKKITRILMFLIFMISLFIWSLFINDNTQEHINSESENDYFSKITPFFFMAIAIVSFFFFFFLGVKEKSKDIHSYYQFERKKFHNAVYVTLSILLIKEIAIFIYYNCNYFDFHALFWGAFGILCFNLMFTIIRIIRN
jgi:ABC-type multidrug transport system permease subunit